MPWFWMNFLIFPAIKEGPRARRLDIMSIWILKTCKVMKGRLIGFLREWGVQGGFKGGSRGGVYDPRCGRVKQAKDTSRDPFPCIVNTYRNFGSEEPNLASDAARFRVI